MDFKKLKKMEEAVRIGGKGSMRRKHKRNPSPAVVEKRVQAELAMLPLRNIGEIQEVTIEFTNSREVVLTMPKVQGTPPNSFFVVSGDLVRKSSTAGPSKVAKAANAPKAPMPPKPPKPEAFSDKKPESGESIKVAKKPKKPRNRVRPRNKKVQMMLSKNKEEAAMAGGDSEPKLSNGKSILISSEDGSDPNNGKVPSDESDVDRTVVCAKDSLRSFGDYSDGKEDDDSKESIYLSSYSDYYDSADEQLNPKTYRAQVSEDED
uniref:Transcription factor BTF3 n=1 Tax=Drosophila melanogaster TaxID=7227 RepID=Q8IR50_DROME|nr:Nascent-associated complex beta-subunit-like, testis 6 [Drosophila melanogaster]AAN09588.1 Nascent-associated complex beta-subunit-like, testis 6 [Drosophila melanogaster]|eukprot:NP_727778.1 Nascent-associated complex beta-subunit-like, testis 6 [Drosophila melanogaster]